MQDKAQETKPTKVSTGAKQAGAADDQIFWRWTWAEPAVWTTRMLTALEQGVKGGSWFSLIDKVYPLLSLAAAFDKGAANKGAAGVDHVTIEMFAANLDVNLRRLAEDLRAGSYCPQPDVWTLFINACLGCRNGLAQVAQPAEVAPLHRATTAAAAQPRQVALRGSQPLCARQSLFAKVSRHQRPQLIRRTRIPKPGSREMRTMGIPTVRDRVVQAALRAVLEPIFERDFAEHSYGFRPERGAKDALRRVDELLEAGYTYVVDADLKSYFDTIPHAPLLALVGAQVSAGRVLALIQAFLEQGVLSELGSEQPETGTPQGAVLSPLLSNIYLDPLDHLIASRGWEMVRYADDFVILCRSEAEARAALDCVQGWTEQTGLILHPGKTHVVDATQKGGFDFLGYHFERGYKWPREKSLKKLKNRLRELTRRTNGESLDEIIR